MLNVKSSRMKCDENEIKINVAQSSGSVLGPSWNLLKRYKFQKKTMGHEKAWQNFIIDFVFEMDNDDAVGEMKRIAELSIKTDVSLVCTCVDEAHCHRSLIKRMIEQRYL